MLNICFSSAFFRLSNTQPAVEAAQKHLGDLLQCTMEWLGASLAKGVADDRLFAVREELRKAQANRKVSHQGRYYTSIVV